MHSRLSKLELEIISIISTDGDIEIAKLSKLVNARPHQTRYAIEKLKQAGLTKPPRPLLDISKLGLTEYLVYFSLSSESHKKRDKILSNLVKNKQITSVIEVGGEFQFLIAMLTKSPYEVHQILNQLVDDLGVSIVRKSVVVACAYTTFGRRYLSQKRSSTKTIGYQCKDLNSDKHDLIDLKIIDGLCNNNFSSLLELSRQLSIPYPTLDRRIKQLKEAQIIVGSIGEINLESLSLQMWKMLIHVRGIEKNAASKIYEFCNSQRNVTAILETFGSWDYEIWYEVGSSENLSRIESHFLQDLERYVHSIKLIPIFGQLKATEYQKIEL